MPAADPIRLIDHARSCLQDALQQWSAADLNCVNECRSLLEQSVADVTVAIELLSTEAAVISTELPPMIVSLRRDISNMIRLVDACSAFQRGWWLCRGEGTPPYDASGQTVPEAGDQPARSVLG